MTRRTAVVLLALPLVACNESCDSWYGGLSITGSVTIVAEDGLRFPVQMVASQSEFNEPPPDFSTDMPLQGDLADLWLRLDQPPRGKGKYLVTESMLRLSGPRPDQVALPRAGWTMQGEFVVTHDRSEDVPPEGERRCATYTARTQKGFLRLQIRGPQGRKYSIHDAQLELTQDYSCEAYHF